MFAKYRPPRIALAYMVFGALWIIFSDRLVEWVLPTHAALVHAQMAKGLLFILVTGGLVYLLVRWSEEALERSLARYSELFSLSPDALFVIGPEGLFLHVNDAAVERYGYSREELLRMGAHDITAPDLQDHIETRLREALTRPVRFEWRQHCKDGHEVPVEITARPIRLDGMACILANVRDLSTLKQAEAAHKGLEERFQRTFGHLLEGIQVIGPDWRYLYVNEAAAAHGGRTAQDLLGLTMMEGFPGIEATEVFSVLRRCMDERTAHRMENAFTRPGGIARWFELCIQPVPEGILILSVDITERKEAEARIEHLNRVLRAIRDVNQLIVRERDPVVLIRSACDILVEHRSYASALIVLTNPDGKPAGWATAGMDGAVGELDGLIQRGELPPCCTATPETGGVLLVHLQDSLCTDCAASQENASANTLCARLVHESVQLGHLAVTLDGQLGADPEEQSLFAEMAGDIAYALHTIRTADERHSLESQLLHAQKMESVGRLAGGVAHDFNNMLQTILGYAGLALEEEELSPSLREALEEIKQAGERSAGLTRQLLAFARQQAIAPKVLDLNDAVSGLLNMLGRLIGEDIDLLWNPGKDLLPVLMDPAQIDQVLANLIVNARDAIAGNGKVTIETRMAEFDEAYCSDHPEFQPGRYVMLAVSDNGCGMAPETLSSIFEPFFTTKAKGHGTGLGLATVYGIVKQNKGFINVYSEPDRGTTFKIYLTPHESGVPAAEDDHESRPAAGGSETVLLVEDEQALLELGRRLLDRLGYRVLPADSPGRALEIAGENPGKIDLLMTDVVMPGMSGRDLWERLAAQHPGLKCLFMSGYTANVISHHGVLDKGIHFLQKPFAIRDLAEKIREALTD